MTKPSSRGKMAAVGIVLCVGLVGVVAAAPTRVGPAVALMPAARASHTDDAQRARTTVWARVFSEEQAKRGAALYVRSCSSCHRDDLSGREGPSLLAPDFFIRWRGQTLAEMLDAIRSIMPDGEPDSLSQQVYLDIIGFLFKYNGVPLGTTDLTTDRPALERILVTDKPEQN